MKKANPKKTRPAAGGKAPKSLLKPEAQASIHRKTRSAHGEEMAQDYAEVIADLIDSSGDEDGYQEDDRKDFHATEHASSAGCHTRNLLRATAFSEWRHFERRQAALSM